VARAEILALDDLQTEVAGDLCLEFLADLAVIDRVQMLGVAE
jgi:hypothetical protein